MFTVILAENDFSENLSQYSLFLEPFLDRNQTAVCEWRTGELTLKDMVPHLAETVAQKDEWRAIILCDESGIYKKNPFDAVDFKGPVRKYEQAPGDDQHTESVTDDTDSEDGNDDEFTDIEGKKLDTRLLKYLSMLKKAKFEAYEKAVQQPLTRLVTYLCNQPLVTKGINSASDDPEFAEYLEEARKKSELRAEIIGNEEITFKLPCEVLCVAKRTYNNEKYDIPVMWESHDDLHYSRFCDWNMYFDKMRFFIYDMMPKNHSNYVSDYINFMYTVLLLAKNDLPVGIVTPGKVYRLGCENDDEALDKLLSKYDAKLDNTANWLKRKINDIKTQQKAKLTDKEASDIFCSNIPVYVTVDKDIERKNLYSDTSVYGLSADCPDWESTVWLEQYKGSKKTMKLLLKQPRRALKKAIGNLRGINEADYEKAMLLNEFQLEDIQEHTDEEELSMVRVPIIDVYDTEHYEKNMQKSDEEIHKKIDTRMKKKTTVLLGICALVLYLIGFLPLIFDNLKISKSAVIALLIIAASISIFALIAYICLFFLRKALKDLLKKFNGCMRIFETDIDNSFALYSKYLSHACNVMRGYSVLNYRKQNEDPNSLNIRILTKHLEDIKGTQAELRDTFGRFMTGKYIFDEKEAEEYDFDFTRQVDFVYPLPYSDENIRKIEFLESGNDVFVPVNFVKRISLRREELYD